MLRRMFEEGCTDREMAEAIPNRTYDAVRRRRQKLGLRLAGPHGTVPWSDAEMRLATELKEKGESTSEIARCLGRSYGSTNALLHRLANGEQAPAPPVVRIERRCACGCGHLLSQHNPEDMTWACQAREAEKAMQALLAQARFEAEQAELRAIEEEEYVPPSDEEILALLPAGYSTVMRKAKLSKEETLMRLRRLEEDGLACREHGTLWCVAIREETDSGRPCEMCGIRMIAPTSDLCMVCEEKAAA